MWQVGNSNQHLHAAFFSAVLAHYPWEDEANQLNEAVINGAENPR
jgi:hypothetical protein